MNPQIAYLLNLSIQQIQSGRLDDAERSLKQVLKIQTKNADALCFLSVVAAYKTEWNVALELINKSIQSAPNNSSAYCNKGNILKEIGRYDDALKCYDRAIQLNSRYYEAYNNKGNTYLELGDYYKSIDAYNKAILLEPNYAEAYSNLGIALHKTGNLIEAVQMHEKAIEIKGDYINAWLNRAFSLSSLKQWGEALKSCDVAISLNPNNARSWTDKGAILRELGLYDKAIAHFDKAICLDENLPETWADRGSTLADLKKYNDAIISLCNAHRKKNDLPYILGDISALKLQIGDWESLDEDLEKINQAIEKKQKVVNPFKYLSMNDSIKEGLDVAKIWVEDRFPEKNILPKIEFKPHKKIRIGYFSADFRNHPVSILTVELFEMHNREKFETYAFSVKCAEEDDELRLRLQGAFDYFIDVESKSDIEVAQLARDLEIHIAIDLGGHTQSAPTGIMSHRAAPIQVNYLGYPGTMGAKYMDYLIADKIVIPEESKSFYTEKIAYLPDCYIVDDSKRIPSNKVFTKEDCGLPENRFIFCCFNNSYKFNKKILKSWSTILKAAPTSVVWISENNESFRKNLIAEFVSLGIDDKRIIFAQRVNLMADHLARYQLADLFLDTHPYNAHTTAVDALKAGVPLITCIGNAFAGRVAASLLNAVGLKELVTTSLQDYERIAIDLASHPEKIKALKARLAINKEKKALFDTNSYVHNIELIYLEMYKRYEKRLPFEHINLSPEIKMLNEKS
ncbi:tetratricopeptide repeat protein [Polynucleobacter paneuropaeus]|uniref:protein O-GlcNAc transferase n=1 Tax=Polynucleobacter paneuropaeus TaxID=2527775 RepID=A0A2Z4JUH3_9BURK|nr:tetratricopeptide repeat protein [Polynucleobacter paneuropaeus]AWW50333.1 hypothetical protein Pas1_08055 [Polynucleobacter paneuropaeus]